MRTYLYISYKCNCNCFFCASDKTNVIKECNEVSLKDAKQFILNSPIKKNLIISGGEPTIHKDFLEIVMFAKQHFEFVSLMTNGIKFADMNFLKSTIEAGVDRISIPFYSSIESEHNYMVGNSSAFEKFIHCISNINELLSEKYFDVQIKLLLSKFTYKLNSDSIDYLASNFPNIKRVSLYGFHISEKGLQHKDECIINYNESRYYNDIAIKKLEKYGLDFYVCEIPLCAFSEETISLLLKSNRIAYTDETYLKRPDRQTKIVSSSVYVPKECNICSVSKLCPKILGKNASSFDFGISPIII